MKNLIFFLIVFIGCSAAQQSISGGDTEFTVIQDSTQKAIVDSIRAKLKDYYIRGIYTGVHIMQYINWRAAQQDTISEKEFMKICKDATDGKNVFELYKIEPSEQ